MPGVDNKTNLELVARAQAGDLDAEDQLVRLNWRFINSKTVGPIPGHLERQDMLQVAAIGFLFAIRTFDPKKAGSLLTHASWKIRGALSRYNANNLHRIRVPLHAHTFLFRMKEDLDAGLAGGPREWAEASKYEADTVLAAHQATRAMRSLNKKIDYARSRDHVWGEFWNSTASDSLQSNEPDPEEATLEKDLRRVIEEALSKMKPRRASWIRARFGLDGDEPKTLQEIGDEYGVSREAVRQQEVRGLREIRKAISEYLACQGL